MRSIEGISTVVLLLVCMTASADAQPINWKPFFTLDPGEGLNFTYDSAAIALNAGVAKLAIAPSDQPMLYFSAQPDKTTRLKNDGRVIEPVANSTDLLHGDGGFIYLTDGRIRYVTEEPGPGNTQQRHISRIVSYMSSDAIHWVREPGIRYQPGSADDSISSVPSVLQVSDSVWRMYYVGDFYRSNGIRTATSQDWGMTWTAESKGNIMRKGDVDPHPVYLSDGRIRLYHRTGFNSPSQVDPVRAGVACTDSPDGVTFDSNQTRLLIPDSLTDHAAKLDPAVIKFPNGDIACFIGASFQQSGKLVVAWERKITTSVAQTSSTEKTLFLYSITPNPVASAATIRFRLPRAGHATLTVYDASGRELIHLLDGNFDAGEYSMNVDRADLPTGFYLLQQEGSQSMQRVLSR